jgi:hypothetical protein
MVLTGENLKVVMAELTTLSLAALLVLNILLGIHTLVSFEILFIFVTLLKIRHLWQLKIVICLHRCLICSDKIKELS